MRPIQERFAELMKDKAHLDDLMKQGREKAAYVARRTMDKTLKKMGFVLSK